METVIGFVIGYLVGTQQGRDGLAKARESVEAIRKSPETKRLIVAGTTVAGSMAKQVLGGAAGTMLTGVLDSVARKATSILEAPSNPPVAAAA